MSIRVVRSWIKTLREKFLAGAPRRSLRPRSGRAQSYATRGLVPTLEMLEDRLVPTTWLVNSNADTLTGAGSPTYAGTLRYDITNSVSGDTINFQSSLGTITLTSVLTAISHNLTITGLGVGSTVISGGPGGSSGFQIFNIASGVTASISSMTIENGYASTLPGAGVYNNGGTVTLTSDMLTGNTVLGASFFATAAYDGLGGAVSNVKGTMTVNNSVLSGNSVGRAGGGIANVDGLMTVNNTTISGNSAFDSGGGVHNFGGTLTVSNSTISGNNAGGGFGGAGSALGGGLRTFNSVTLGGGTAEPASVTLLNDTITGNVDVNGTSTGTGGGVEVGNGTITLSNDTITANSANYNGGLATGGTCTVLNSIIAGNNATGSNYQNIGNGQNTAAVLSVADDNLFTNTTGISITAGTGNLYTTTAGVTLGLATSMAASNGGPTGTVALLTTSSAVNAGGALTTLTSAITTTTGTTITVGNAASFDQATPNIGTYIWVGTEEMLVTGVSTSTNTLTVTRGVNGTMAITDLSGVAVYLGTDQRGFTDPPAPISPATTPKTDIGAFQLQSVTVNTATLANSATTITINGFGFDPTAANDVVTLSNSVTGVVSGTVTSATSTSLTVGSINLSSVPSGTPLTATVAVDSVTGPSAVQVATVVIGGPTVTRNTANLPANATTLTITGTGFDPTGTDTVTFTPSGVTGTMTSTTAGSLTVSLTGLTSQVADTALTAIVTVDGNSSPSAVQVATVEPVVTSSSANLPVNATSLTIAGFAFDTNTAHDTVSFSNGGVTGTVSSATSTSLTVILTGLSSLSAGTALNANVTVDTVSSGSAVQVATIAPVVNLNTITNILDSSTSIIITGSGFSTNTANDTVVFNLNVAGSVTAASATQLTVTITSQPTALGNLTAVVTANSVSSGTAVQVATEIAGGTFIVTDSNGAAGSGSFTDITLPWAVTHTFGGDFVTFASSLSGGNVITLGSTLSIGHNLTITGLGAGNLYVNGNISVQVFNIGSGVTASISSMTIENGYLSAASDLPGAGVYNNGGTVTLTSDTITGNTDSGASFNASLNWDGIGGGVSNVKGTMTINNSVVSSNSIGEYGGGIGDVYGVLTINNTTVNMNSVGLGGGGICNFGGTMTLSNSAVTNNSTPNSGSGFGGGIRLVNSPSIQGNTTTTQVSTLINDTITGNKAYASGYSQSAGGVEIGNGNLTLSNDTITGNTSSYGGGLNVASSAATVTVQNSRRVAPGST